MGVVGVVGRSVGPVEHSEPPQPGQQVVRAGHYAQGGVVVSDDSLGGRVEDQVHPVGQRGLPERGSERGVDHRQGVTDSSQGVEVHQVQPWVGWRLGEHQHRPAGNHGGGERLRIGPVHEGHVDAQPRTGRLEEQLGPGVQLALGHDVVAGRADGQHHGADCSHTRGESSGGLPTL